MGNQQHERNRKPNALIESRGLSLNATVLLLPAGG